MIKSLVKKLLNLFKQKKPLFKHLRAIRLRKLWNEYGRGEGTTVIVLDMPGYHGEAVTEIIKRIAPKAEIKFASWLNPGNPNLSRIPEALEEIYEEHYGKEN